MRLDDIRIRRPRHSMSRPPGSRGYMTGTGISGRQMLPFYPYSNTYQTGEIWSTPGARQLQYDAGGSVTFPNYGIGSIIAGNSYRITGEVTGWQGSGNLFIRVGGQVDHLVLTGDGAFELIEDALAEWPEVRFAVGNNTTVQHFLIQNLQIKDEGVVPTYAPLENHPDWYNITSPPVASGTEGRGNGEVSMVSGTSPDQVIAFGTDVITDGGIQLTMQYSGNSYGHDSFVGAIRMTDEWHYLGVQQNGGLLRLYEVNGTFTELGTAGISGIIGSGIRLVAIGNQVTVEKNGSPIITATTSLLTAGRVGLAARGWTVGRKLVADNYAVINLD